jgi:hypothetical protein
MWVMRLSFVRKTGIGSVINDRSTPYDQNENRALLREKLRENN